MAAFAYDAINAQGLEISGEIHAPTSAPPASSCRRAGCCRRRWPSATPPASAGPRTRVQEGEAEVAAGLRPPARDDDRGRRQRRSGARDARGADRRQVSRRGDRRGPLRRRGRRDPLEGVRAASEGLQPPVRRDDRGGRVVGNARHRARPRRDADREGDADQAPRQGRDGLPGRRHHASHRSCSPSC